MKKLLLFAFSLLLFSKSVAAQEKSPANSLTVHVGPNAFFQRPTTNIKNVHYEPLIGYTAGLDFVRKVSKHWHLKIGLRYNTWNSASKRGPFIYELDLIGGGYNPDPKYITIHFRDKAWQLLAGAGWQSKPQKKWRWNVGAEIGVTSPTKPGKVGDVMRLTTGLYVGSEWSINRHIHLFLQPGGRFVFNNLKKSDFKGYRFLALQLETGVRYVF